jgi:hypothetical protein
MRKKTGRKTSYEKPHVLSICVEESDFQKINALAENRCGGNVTKYINKVISAFLTCVEDGDISFFEKNKNSLDERNEYNKEEI